MYWSDGVLEEMRRTIVLRGETTEPKSHKLVAQMNKAFAEARVTNYQHLTAAMKNDPKDRHVCAAAVQAGATVVVTNNLRDFCAQDMPAGVEAQSADSFLVDLLDLAPDNLVELLRAQAADLRHPPMTFEELLEGLSRSVPSFVKSVRAHVAGGAGG